MTATPPDPKEAVRCLAAYLGGKLRAGDVPIGAKLAPQATHDQIATLAAAHGFAITFDGGPDIFTARLRAAPQES